MARWTYLRKAGKQKGKVMKITRSVAIGCCAILLAFGVTVPPVSANTITFDLTNCNVETNSLSSFGTVTVTVPSGGGSATLTVSLNSAVGSGAEVEDIFFNTTPSTLTSSLVSSGTITTNAPAGVYTVQPEGAWGAASGGLGTYDWKIDTGGSGAAPGTPGLPQNFRVTITNANITSASNFLEGVSGMSGDTFYTAVEITDVNTSTLGDSLSTVTFGAGSYTAVAEPTTVLLLGSGLVGLAAFSKRFKKA